MYYTVIKHSGYLGTLEKCRKHSPAARVFYISLVFSNARRVLSQCNTRLRFLHLLINRLFTINARSKNNVSIFGYFITSAYPQKAKLTAVRFLAFPSVKFLKIWQIGSNYFTLVGARFSGKSVRPVFLYQRKT